MSRSSDQIQGDPADDNPAIIIISLNSYYAKLRE
jgi:hypothetical protein